MSQWGRKKEHRREQVGWNARAVASERARGTNGAWSANGYEDSRGLCLAVVAADVDGGVSSVVNGSTSCPAMRAPRGRFITATEPLAPEPSFCARADPLPPPERDQQSALSAEGGERGP